MVGYKKIKNYTREVLGVGEVDLPEFTFDTTGMWLVLNTDTVDQLRSSGLWLNDPNNYGPDWNQTRKADQGNVMVTNARIAACLKTEYHTMSTI